MRMGRGIALPVLLLIAGALVASRDGRLAGPNTGRRAGSPLAAAATQTRSDPATGPTRQGAPTAGQHRGAVASARAGLEPGHRSLILKLHEAALRADTKALREMVDALQGQPESVRLTALWAIARVGSIDALKAVRKVAAEGGPPGRNPVREYAQVVAARLEAMARTPGRDAASVKRQMQSVLDGVGLTAQRAEAAVQRRFDDGPEVRLSRCLMYELADMALVAANRGVLGAGDLSPVDLSLTPPSRAKALCSRYAPAERIRWLVKELSHKEVNGGFEDFQVQCLVNEGPAARPVIIARLAEMARKPGEIHGSGPVDGLFRALQGLGGTPEAVAAVEPFRQHPNKHVRGYAEDTCRFLRTGERRFRVVGY